MNGQTSGGGNLRLGRYETAARGKLLRVAISMYGSVFGSPVFIPGKTVFLADATGLLKCLDWDGQLLWARNMGGAIQASPALQPSGARIFVPTNAGMIHAVDAQTGKVEWSRSIAEKNDPRILTDLLYLPKHNAVIASSWQENFTALNADSGEAVAVWNAGAFPQSAAAADSNETVYIMRVEYSWERGQKAGMRLVKVNPSSGEGESLFFQPCEEAGSRDMWAHCAPAVDEERGVIYCVSNIKEKGTLHAVSMNDGREMWRSEYSRQIDSDIAVAADGTVFVGDMFGNATAYALDGAKKFVYETGSLFIQSGVIVDRAGTAFFGDNEGKIHMLSADGTGEVIYESDHAIQSRPAIDSSGRLWVASMDGEVYVFDQG